jgi:tetratricopeptide (TPR) repeat protein
LRRYRELTIAYPENIEAHLGLARVENTTGRFEQAEEILKKLAAEHPDSTQVRLELGQLYSQREDWNSATLAFEQACRLAPHDQTCRYELGVAMARNGLTEQALPHLTFAVGGPAAHYNIGYLLHEQRRDEEAEEWLRQALTMHPDQKTADQSRRLLAQLASEGNSAVATSGAKRGSAVRPAGASQEKRVDADEAESAGGVRQAAWFEEGQIESRLRGMGEDRPGPVDVQPSELPSAGAISLPRNKGAQRGSAAPSGPSGQSGSSLPKPLEPPVWKSARPVDR